jgi:hypothetical protein
VFKPEERPKRNKATTRFQQYKAERSARDQRTIDQKMKHPIQSEPDLPLGNPEQSAHNATAQKCTDSTSSKFPTPDPYLPYETVSTKLMEALCVKERENWKKAWEFEMYRATKKHTWEDVEEEEYTASDTADLVNSLKKQILEGVKQRL